MSTFLVVVLSGGVVFGLMLIIDIISGVKLSKKKGQFKILLVQQKGAAENRRDSLKDSRKQLVAGKTPYGLPQDIATKFSEIDVTSANDAAAGDKRKLAVLDEAISRSDSESQVLYGVINRFEGAFSKNTGANAH